MTRMSAGQRRIHEAALKLFAAKGTTEVSVSELAQAAGVARGTVYNNLKSPEMLFKQVATQLAEEMDARVVATYAAAGITDPALKMAIGIRCYLRRAHEERLARRYHAALMTRGVRDYGWERCWHDYRLLAPHGLIMAVVGAALTTPTERGDRMLSTMINRHAAQMTDLGSLGLIR